MNRVYKVVWNKARGCYMVASELAKRASKSSGRKVLAAGVLSAVLATGVVSPAMAAGANVTYDDADASIITLEGEVGVGTKITNLADGDLSAASTDAVTGAQLYSVQQEFNTFQSALSRNNSTIAAAQADINTLKNSYVTLNSTVNTLKTQVETGFNVTIDGAKVKQVNPDANQVNFVTGKNVTLTAQNGGVKVDVNGTGTVASGDTGLLNGGTAYTELRPANGNYVKLANTTAANLIALDGAVKANEDAIDALDDGKANVALDNITNAGKTVVRNLAKEAVKVVAGEHTTVTEGVNGVAKTYAVNVAADGAVAANNTGLVNGGTVYNALRAEARPAANGNYITKANTAGANLTALDAAVKANKDAIDELDDGKANVSLDNITNAGKTVIQNATNVVSGDEIIDVTSAVKNGVKTYTVKANIGAGGVIEANNTGLVNGGTVYNEVRPAADGNYITVANTAGANLTALDTAVKANTDAIEDINADLDGKANVSLDNITDAGKTVVRNLAKESVKMVAGEHTTVTEGEDGVAKTYAVNVVADGVVAEGNTHIVTGDAVYQAINAVPKYTAGTGIAIDGNEISVKNVVMYDSDSKDSVTLEGNRGTKLTNLKAATLAQGSKDAVIGHQLWSTNQDMAGLKQDISTNKANISALNDSVSNTLESVSTMNTLVNTIDELKADASLNNLTAAGKQVISTAAANAVQEYMAGNNKVVPINKMVTMGKSIVMNAIVPDDDSNATGGEVYTAIEDAKTELQGSIDAKADLSYVDEMLDTKADKVDLDAKADIEYVDNALEAKADKDSVYTKDEADAMLAEKADVAMLEEKANVDASNIDVDAWTEKLGVSGNDMVTAGDVIAIGLAAKYDAIDSVSIAKSDGSGRVLRGVVVDPTDETSAANVGYVNNIAENIASGVNQGFSKLDSKINKTGAGAAALANLHPLNDDGDTRWNIAAGFGRYHGESAGAVGVFYKPSDRVAMNISSTIGDKNDTMFGAGVTFAVDKPMANDISKAEMAKTINVQAQQINAQTQAIRTLADDNAKQAAEIAELKAAVAKLAK